MVEVRGIGDGHMKKRTVFMLGGLSGVMLTLIVLTVVGIVSGRPEDITSDSGFTRTEHTEFLVSDRFKVFQTIDGGALAFCGMIPELSDSPVYLGPAVFIVGKEGEHYDGQVVVIPYGECEMIGTYRYMSNSGEKTVPVIRRK